MSQSENAIEKSDPGSGFRIPDTEAVSGNLDQDTRQTGRVNVSWVVAIAMVISSLAALITAIKA
ncbi:hypothetical protein ABZ656_47440 [Streptomyces sp. NPDC007095]|uniref:hypothetical protein n=1 Tax=Streptomyces sp. NPDC007095 TaxID=3154482 RepID=UPI0033E61E06